MIISNDFRTKNNNIENVLETDKKRSLGFFLNFPSKVYLHATEEVTGYDILPQFLWEYKFFVDLLVTMKQTHTTNDVEQLSPAQRKCIVQGEKDSNNDFYSSTTCMLQCRMEKANKLCKCIPPFYSPTTESFQECASKEELECLKENRHNITQTKGCSHCLLSCSNTVYESDKLTQL
jgi:Amiloride-sensitive sodium channel